MLTPPLFFELRKDLGGCLGLAVDAEAKCQEGNIECLATFGLLKHAANSQRAVTCALEQPAGSYMLKTDAFRAMRKEQLTCESTFDQCQYGTPYRNPPTMVSTVTNKDVLRRCLKGRCSGEAGICSATNCKHVWLRGSKVKKTSIYTRKLARAIADALSRAAC